MISWFIMTYAEWLFDRMKIQMMRVMMSMKQMRKLLWKATQPHWMRTVVVSTNTSYSKKFCKVRIRTFFFNMEKKTRNLTMPVFVAMSRCVCSFSILFNSAVNCWATVVSMIGEWLSIEHWWSSADGGTLVPGNTLVPVPLCSSQMSHRPTGDWI